MGSAMSTVPGAALAIEEMGRIGGSVQHMVLVCHRWLMIILKMALQDRFTFGFLPMPDMCLVE